jgi:hypothetical protein
MKGSRISGVKALLQHHPRFKNYLGHVPWGNIKFCYPDQNGEELPLSGKKPIETVTHLIVVIQMNPTLYNTTATAAGSLDLAINNSDKNYFLQMTSPRALEKLGKHTTSSAMITKSKLAKPVDSRTAARTTMSESSPVSVTENQPISPAKPSPTLSSKSPKKKKRFTQYSKSPSN